MDSGERLPLRGNDRLKLGRSRYGSFYSHPPSGGQRAVGKRGEIALVLDGGRVRAVEVRRAPRAG